MVSSATVGCEQTMTSYQRLQKALSAGLRRQIFLAVCEESQGEDSPTVRDRFWQDLQETISDPPLIPIILEGENPNFLGAIAAYLKTHPHLNQQQPFPTFAIMGIEGLTRQPALLQQQFLRNLRRLARHLPQLQFSLLLWVSPPWLHTIQQSAPEFWRWHSGVFELTADSLPGATPQPSPQNSPEKPIPKEGEFPLVALPKKSPPPQPSPAKPAQLGLEGGHYWRDRIAQGDQSYDTLSRAIEAYESAIAPQTPSSLEADLLNDLGNFYWMRSRSANRGEAPPEQAYPDLEQALNTYLSALAKISDPKDQPHTYAMIHNNLGAAYGDLARYRDFEENLQFSIEAYETALQYRNARNNALKYGSTQNNLGTAYWHLAQRQNPIEHLQKAIAAYTEASHQYNPDQDPLSWAMIQNNIGTAHWNLAKYQDPHTHLQAAIQCYEQSLRFRTPTTAPALCAATQNNLGTAYWHLSTTEATNDEQKCHSLQKSAQAYATATQLAHQLSLQDPPVQVNFNFHSTYNNLGLVHYQLALNERFALPTPVRLDHLDAALQAHLQALTAFPQDSDPYQTAFKYIARTVRAFYQQGGINGQNRALGQVPGQLLPQLLPQL